jgi:hypothetical protein
LEETSRRPVPFTISRNEEKEVNEMNLPGFTADDVAISNH